MPTRRRRRFPRAAPLGVVAVAAGLALGAAALREDATGGTGHPAAAPPLRIVPEPAAALAAGRQVGAPARAATVVSAERAPAPARPVRVVIPVIGVRAAIVPLGLHRDRTLETPTDFAQVGWWAGGPRPGAPGAAVLVGHVDSKAGPAVFYALRTLRRGDAIRVVGGDGRVRRFVVQRLARFAKDRFPTHEVYGPFRRPRLRLITCGGAFDARTGHYRDNTVVFARPDRAR